LRPLTSKLPPHRADAITFAIEASGGGGARGARAKCRKPDKEMVSLSLCRQSKFSRRDDDTSRIRRRRWLITPVIAGYHALCYLPSPRRPPGLFPPPPPSNQPFQRRSLRRAVVFPPAPPADPRLPVPTTFRLDGARREEIMDCARERSCIKRRSHARDKAPRPRPPPSSLGRHMNRRKSAVRAR